MKKWLLVCLIYSISFAQNYGYVKFESDKTWIIEINDSLLTSPCLLEIESRPQISYVWPALSIDSSITITTGDTSYYRLAADISNSNTGDINMDLAETKVYKEADYQPQSQSYSKLKTGLLIGAIAANWVSFYLKRQADDNYSKYTHASNMDAINRYYDRAADFDKASTLMLSLSAAVLTGYIYLSLSE
jgi:hypothetical protein